MDAPVVHSRVEGEVEDPQEKKSVMKKVKAKAKKLKNTLTKHGHQGHEQEADETVDNHDGDEEDDEEVDSPEAHGAPIYDSPVKRTDAPVQGGTRAGRDEFNPVVRENNVGVTDPIKSSVPGLHGTSGARHEEPKGLGGGTHAPQTTPVSSRPKYDTAAMDVDQVKTSDTGKGGHLGESRFPLGKTDVLGEETPLPQSSPASSLAHGTRKDGMDVDPKQALVSGQGGKDPHAPKASPQAYETKATDPTKSGGEDIGVTPMSHSFDKMNLHGDDRQHLTNQDKSTGSHDQFSPGKPSNQGSSYIGSATSAITSTAMSAKNAVASKLGYGATESAEHATGAGKSGSSPAGHQNQVLDPSTNEFRPTETPQVRGTIQPEHKTGTDLKQSNQAGGTYTGKVSSATSAVTDRAISAKNVIASKLGYGPSDQVHDSGDVSRTNVQSGSTQPDQQGKTMTSSLMQKLTPTVVASKLGYGPSDQVRDSGDVSRTNVQSGSTQADQQGKPMTSTVTEKLAPVYGKVAGAGTAVMSKFKGGGTALPSDQVRDSGDVSRTDVQSGSTQTDQQGKPLTSTVTEKLAPVYGKVAGAGTAVMSKFKGGGTASTGRDTSSGDVNQAGQEKGGSMKDYFVEKLRPGEEDKALSQVISEKWKIQKPGVKEQTGEPASGKPMGKVTESEEVKQRLGNTEGNDNFMVNKIVDTVRPMLGGTNKEDDEHQRGLATSAADTSGEDRRLQEN